MEFKRLYKNNKLNIKTWNINVVGYPNYSEIVTQTGIIDGKITEFIVKITKGKNIGKINETSHLEQAISEAKYKYQKKIDSGYSHEMNSKIEVVLPMLLENYHDRKKDIVFPCFVQPKLDGVRCIYINGKLISRTGKNFACLNNILDELKDVSLQLDGELYSDNLTFQEISGIVRKIKLSDKDLEKINKIKYVIYDVILTDTPFVTRFEKLKKLFKEHKFKNIELLKTEIIESPDLLDKKHDNYTKEGYEGLVIRNLKGLYSINRRSVDVQKYKKFDDAEFEIIGATTGVGNEKGAVIWECITKTGLKFHTRPIGTMKERRTLFKNSKDYIGKMITIKYFGLTDEGIPRFPIGISLRDYE